MNNFQFRDEIRLEPKKIEEKNRVTKFIEIYNVPTQEHTQTQAGRCLDCGNPYCSWRCPLHNYIPEWLKLAEDGEIFKACDLMHETNSLPEVCGRVCPQDRLCEGACTLNTDFGAVTIGNVEKYVVDEAIKAGWKPKIKASKRIEKVAIIGAGPAGIGCADILIRNGIQVTVYDKNPQIGGLLTYGIPTFKLDKDVIQTRRQVLEGMGIEFKLGMNVGVDIRFEDIMSQYDAIFLGTGTYTAMQASIDNEDAKGVHKALDYLIGNAHFLLGTQSSSEPYIDLKDKKVVVLGGGDTAMDCVRTAIRQGAADVVCAYRRDEANMPGSRREVNNAKEEGAKFLFNCQPIAIEAIDKKVTGISVVNTKMGKRDSSGRQIAEVIEGSEQIIKCDVIITAFGFLASPPDWLGKFNVKLTDKKLIDVKNNQFNYQTSNSQIFAGGDMVRGSDLVVTAIDEGRKAAAGIINFLDSKK